MILRSLQLFRRGSAGPSLTYDHGSMLRSWAFSSDSRMLALGYVDGEIELLDTATGTPRRLGPGSSAVPVRLVFSEDEQVECPECRSKRLDRLISLPGVAQAKTDAFPSGCGDPSLPPCGAPGCRRVGR